MLGSISKEHISTTMPGSDCTLALVSCSFVLRSKDNTNQAIKSTGLPGTTKECWAVFPKNILARQCLAATAIGAGFSFFCFCRLHDNRRRSKDNKNQAIKSTGRRAQQKNAGQYLKRNAAGNKRKYGAKQEVRSARTKERWRDRRT